MIKRFSILVYLMSMLLSYTLYAQDTQVVYLSGTGFDNTVEWDFYCTAGMNGGALQIELTFDFR